VRAIETPHGTPSGYSYHGCRCGSCTDAHRNYQWLRTQVRREWLAKLPAGVAAPFEHGASAYCNWGCRCGTCTRANTAKAAERRAAGGRRA
jgi:hypothetical protein